ncbi:MAG: polysaccharide deacetylase family protein [Actinomycetota bacterium]|nr:polysaccharide deacetylase family protein [Actinomycetota bacterium]
MITSSPAVRVLGSRPISSAVCTITANRLRAVAYHAVPDPVAFDRQLAEFVRQGFSTVTGAAVADALHGGAPLPTRALWITFDDGDVSVVRAALPLLAERGMVATAFLCGGWIDSTVAPWWRVVEAAVEPGALTATRMALKQADDRHRRDVVADMAEGLAVAGTPVVGRQWTAGDITAWTAAGNDIGNHSWDHPCLDRCDDAEQRRQVRLAHERLTELTGRHLDVFAWPNGDAAPAALDELRALGYRLVAACDHRLAARHPDPWQLSRLRLDTTVDVARTRAVLSGAHSGAFHVWRRIRGGGPSSAVT